MKLRSLNTSRNWATKTRGKKKTKISSNNNGGFTQKRMDFTVC